MDRLSNAFLQSGIENGMHKFSDETEHAFLMRICKQKMESEKSAFRKRRILIVMMRTWARAQGIERSNSEKQSEFDALIRPLWIRSLYGTQANLTTMRL